MSRLLHANFVACFYAALAIAAVLGPVHHSVFHVWELDGVGSHHAHHSHHDDADVSDHGDALVDDDSSGQHETDCCGFQLAREKATTVGHDFSKAAITVAWIAPFLSSCTSVAGRAQLSALLTERPPDSPGDIARLRTILLLV
jgi:hypothetical protein